MYKKIRANVSMAQKRACKSGRSTVNAAFMCIFDRAKECNKLWWIRFGGIVGGEGRGLRWGGEGGRVAPPWEYLAALLCCEISLRSLHSVSCSQTDPHFPHIPQANPA